MPVILKLSPLPDIILCLKGEVMIARTMLARLACLLVIVSVLGCGPSQRTADIVAQPYLLGTGLVSRSISFENPTGAPGEGGKAASRLGVGRKGKPAITLKSGEGVQLCDIQEQPVGVDHHGGHGAPSVT